MTITLTTDDLHNLSFLFLVLANLVIIIRVDLLEEELWFEFLFTLAVVSWDCCVIIGTIWNLLHKMP